MTDEDPRKAALYEAAESLARSRVRLDGLEKVVGEAHPMRAEEQRLHDERRKKFIALVVESGIKLDREQLLKEIAPVADPHNRDESVRAITLALLLEASASDPPPVADRPGSVS